MNNRRTDVRSLLASRLFLTAVIAFTAAAVLEAIAFFSIRASIMESAYRLVDFYGNFPLYSLVWNAANGSAAVIVLVLLPRFFLTAALWRIYAAASSEDSIMRTSGLKMVEVYLTTVYYVFSGIAVLSLLGVVVSLLGADSIVSAPGLNIRKIAAMLSLVLAAVILVCALAIVLLMRAKENCRCIHLAVLTGREAGFLSPFVSSACYVLGILFGLDALRTLADSNLIPLMECANAIAAFSFGLFLSHCRRSIPQTDYTPAGTMLLCRETGVTTPLGVEAIVIGQNPGIHAAVCCQDGQYYLVDEDSAAPITLNGSSLEPNTPVPLMDRACFQVGKETYFFLQA